MSEIIQNLLFALGLKKKEHKHKYNVVHIEYVGDGHYAYRKTHYDFCIECGEDEPKELPIEPRRS